MPQGGKEQFIIDINKLWVHLVVLHLHFTIHEKYIPNNSITTFEIFIGDGILRIYIQFVIPLPLILGCPCYDISNCMWDKISHTIEHVTRNPEKGPMNILFLQKEVFFYRRSNNGRNNERVYPITKFIWTQKDLKNWKVQNRLYI